MSFSVKYFNNATNLCVLVKLYSGFPIPKMYGHAITYAVD